MGLIPGCAGTAGEVSPYSKLVGLCHVFIVVGPAVAAPRQVRGLRGPRYHLSLFCFSFRFSNKRDLPSGRPTAQVGDGCFISQRSILYPAASRPRVLDRGSAPSLMKKGLNLKPV